MLGMGTKFDKSLLKDAEARAESVAKLEEFNKSVEKSQKGIDNLTEEIKDNQNSMEGMDKRTTEYKKLLADTADLQKNLNEKKQVLSEKKEEGKGFEKQNAEQLKSINKSLFNIDDSEIQAREDFDKQVKIQEDLLAELKKDPNVSDKDVAKKQKNIDKMKEKESTRRERAGMNIFKRGFLTIQDGLGGIAKVFGKLGTTGKLALTGVAFFALAKFLQSPMFARVSTYITDTVIPAAKKFFDFIMQPGGVFDSLISAFQNIGEFFVGAYEFIQGIFRGDSGLVKEGINSMIDGFYGLIEDLIEIVLGLLGFSPEETAKFMEPISAFFDSFTQFLKDMMGGIVDGIAYLFTGDIIGDIKKLVSNTISNIGQYFSDLIDNGILFLKAMGAGIIAGIKALAPFGETPEDAFAKAFEKTMSSGEKPDIQQMQEGFRANQISAAGYDLKNIDKSPDSMRTNQPQQTQTNTIVNNNNTVQQGDSVTQSYEAKYVRDQDNAYAGGGM